MSLRARLLLATAAIAVVALVAADIATYAALRSSLYSQIDNGLALSLRSVVSSVGAPLGGPGLQGSPPGSPPQTCPAFTGDRVGAGGLAPGTTIEVRNASGQRVYRCAITSLDTAVRWPDLPARIGGVPRSIAEGGHDASNAAVSAEYFTAGATSGGASFRVSVTGLPDGPAAGGQLIIAVPLSGTDSTLNTLRDLELLVTAVAVLVALALGWWLVQLSLRPLRDVERTAAAIADGQFTERVPGDQARTEVGRLARALNVMLGRIQSAFAERDRKEEALRASEERLRRFVADASHELRTPVAAVQAYAELFDRGAADRPDDLARVLRGIRSESARMGHLVEDLLLLARLDEGRAVELHPLDLVVVAADAVATAAALGPGWPVRLVAEGPVEVLGDGLRLRQVLDNLLGNVRVHCPTGTQATVTVAQDGAEAVVSVQDDGPGMDPEQAARIFERFFRIDPSRSRHQGGAGLGLAIVDAIVRAHGGRVDVQAAAGGGTGFEVRLPVIPLAETLQPERHGTVERARASS